ncbi:MAG TPA: glycosyltransferase [Thermoanaerobaculia bacterium]|nr:glycosyltransferase [Thermoanaerobaculia bacterium]
MSGAGVSVVIPTHDRRRSLERTLTALGVQTAKPHEVVVVADGCTDGTADWLRSAVWPFPLQVVEQPAAGAAAARNAGAERARGELLLFLDDDVEPAPGLVAAHAEAHRTGPEKAVSGPALPVVESRPGFFAAGLRAWWFEVYREMGLPGHRFTYRDVLTGNLSLPAALFARVGGFAAGLRCREDFELGVRLLAAGADLAFAPCAVACHFDGTGLDASLQRARQEGRGDARIGARHPHLLPALELSRAPAPLARLAIGGQVLGGQILGGPVAAILRRGLDVLETARLRRRWRGLYGALRGYWYWRGVAEETGSRHALRKLLARAPAAGAEGFPIDLRPGIAAAESILDRERPRGLRILYDGQEIGAVACQPGAEPLRGAHLRRLLAERMPAPVRAALALAGLNGADAGPLPSTVPPISVVVCTRDRTALLEKCLRSLLALDYPAYEVVVVDNAPRDDATARLVAALPVRYVREPRPGLDHARNRGIAEARHDLIAFTDDDTRADSGWLSALARAFADPRVAAVTGLVAPAELETPAERYFELGYGGMGKGLRPRMFRRERMEPEELIAIQAVGVGANMAFRRGVLAAAGGFDPALDVGTPAHGGGDLDMFHRVVAGGWTLRYDPAALVWHQHRREMGALYRQLLDDGRSYGVYLLKRWREGEVPRKSLARFVLVQWCPWLAGRILRGLLGRHDLPLPLLWANLRGALQAPWAYAATYRKDRRPHGP